MVEPERRAVALDRGHRQERLELLGHGEGPPPGPAAVGVEKVLCRFMWTMSKPMSPGHAIPKKAFKFAPSK